MSESKVQVAVRVRPLSGKEKLERCTPCVDVISDRELVMGGDKQFTFDYAFGSETEQEAIYAKCVAPLVENLFEGYNATVFAYGQTGSGKTFTMGSGCAPGSVGGIEYDQNRGVIPRATEQIFQMIADKRVSSPDAEFYIRVQFLELYGEDLRDLLDPVGTAQRKQVSIRDGPNDTLQIVGGTEETAKSPGDMLALLEKGTLCRTTGSTDMNTHSSRSHAIFTIVLEQQIKNGGSEDVEYRTAKFHFVDLAGSERAKRTGATGQRMKEGININMGLLALGNVISALGSEDTEKTTRHVPYRDSKLTRMLQDSLGGNSRTLMITCVSPADVNFEETLNALRYANRARNIKNRAIVNRDPASSQIAALKAQVAQLKQLIANGGSLADVGDVQDAKAPKPPMSASSSEYKRRCRLLEEEVTRLSKALEMEKQSRIEVEDRYGVLKAERLAYLGPSDTSSIEEEEEEGDEEEEEADDANGDESEANASDEEEEEDESAKILKTRFKKSQKALRKLFSTYDQTLRSKEEAMKQIIEERKKYEALKTHFESKMAEMNEEVKETQAQREALEAKLRGLESEHQQTDASRAEAARLRALLQEKDKRLRELEERTRQLQEARRNATEWQRKEAQVRADIENVKREKVELQRKMTENQKRHTELLRERQLEIAGLKRERARLEQGTQQLAARTERDSRLLQLKSEQVAAMQRKLREAQRLISHPQQLSERDRKQRKEIERLAALQVKREEELADLRRALAKKEEAIARRNALLEQLQKLKANEPVKEESISITDLVPEATHEDIRELEQRLEALDSEIHFRDRQCHQVLLNDDGTEKDQHQQTQGDYEQLMLTFASLDQAKDVCRVLMQLFVQSKRELRERKMELDRIKDQVLHQNEAVKLERRRTETLLLSSNSPSSQRALDASTLEADAEESSSILVNDNDEVQAENDQQNAQNHTLATPSKNPPGVPHDPRLLASEARIRTIEAKLRSLRVDDDSPEHADKAKPSVGGDQIRGYRRSYNQVTQNKVTVPVWDRLTSPSAATGIHKYGIRRSLHQTREQQHNLNTSNEQQEEECIDEIVKVPRRNAKVRTDESENQNEEQKASFTSSSPTSPEKPKAGWERLASQYTESYQNKRLLDAEARKNAAGMRQSVALPPNGAKPSATELRKMRKEHLVHERARRRRQTRAQDDDHPVGLEQEDNALADEAPA